MLSTAFEAPHAATAGQGVGFLEEPEDVVGGLGTVEALVADLLKHAAILIADLEHVVLDRLTEDVPRKPRVVGRELRLEDLVAVPLAPGNLLGTGLVVQPLHQCG